MLDDWRAGLRAEVGLWLDPGREWSTSARFYSLFSTSEQFVGIGDGTNILYLVRPTPPASVGNLAGRQPSYVGFPGVVTGSVATTAQTTFTGGDLNLRHVLFAGDRCRFQALAGYRQMHLGDELGIAFTVNPTPAAATTYRRSSPPGEGRTVSARGTTSTARGRRCQSVTHRRAMESSKG